MANGLAVRKNFEKRGHKSDKKQGRLSKKQLVKTSPISKRKISKRNSASQRGKIDFRDNKFSFGGKQKQNVLNSNKPKAKKLKYGREANLSQNRSVKKR